MHTSARAVTAGLLLSAFALTACTPFPPGARLLSPEPSDSASVDAGETPEPADDAGSPPTEITFAAGAELDPALWTVGWDDRLMAADERFATSSPDDGNGSWAYLDGQTQCTVAFYQGAITDLELGADDRESTDNMLAAVLSTQIPGVTGADVSANASDDYVAQTTQEGTVDIRMVGGSGGAGGDEASWSEFGRTFGTLGTSLVVNVECPPGQDVATEVTDLLGNYLGIAVAPASG
ncbi:hypothetical protein MRBLMI12_003000 [Microbacterium sp. LMI12-1-1.1]|uniref:hypothetical protein n=1 Tax=unclassified Microbacterium TaxID=2609290 RepID=UPI0034249F64